jgi:hypothetical protein
VDELPRLEGIATESERRLFAHVLADVDRRVHEGVDLDQLRAQLGPQLVIAAPRQLLVEADRSVLARLRRRYLERPVEEPSEPVTHERRLAEKYLDKMLGGLLSAPGPKPMRRVTPERLFPDLPPKVFRGRVPPLARAVRGAADDVLIDGVMIEPSRIDESVRVATVRIDRAFWYYDRARKAIENAVGRRVFTVGILLDAANHKDSSVEDARLYVREAWDRHADRVIDVRKAQELKSVRSEIARLTAG